MSGNGPLKRLLRVRMIEEEQLQAELQSAIVRLRQIEGQLTAVKDQKCASRKLLAASVQIGDAVDRMAALEQMKVAERADRSWRAILDQVKREVENRSKMFLAKRIERRQAETLLEQAESERAAAAARRQQQMLDDWYLHRPQGSNEEILSASSVEDRS